MKPRRQSNFSTARFRPERALLDQIQERDTQTAIPLRDRHDEPKVRLDHHPLRHRVATLDLLRERHLLGGGQQLVATDVGEEQLQAVSGTRERLRLPDLRLGGLLLLLGGLGLRVTDLEPDRLELTCQRLRVMRSQLVLGDECVELGRLDETALLGAFDERLHLLGLEQFIELILGQVVIQSFRQRLFRRRAPRPALRTILSVSGFSCFFESFGRK